MGDLLQVTDAGLYCAAGDFHIDPWAPVSCALITHAHSDHARAGSGRYFCAMPGVGLLRERLGAEARVAGVAYGEPFLQRGVKVSFHPAGHILGSAQIRVEHQGEVWVVSGDYKLADDPTCARFEPVKCDVFVTESTFGLPIYRWRPPEEIFREIEEWWRESQGRGRTAVLFCYGLGKAQRILASIDASIGPIFLHGSVVRHQHAYEAAGCRMPSAEPIEKARAAEGRGLVLAPPSENASPWLRRFGEVSTAFASGWMQVRGARRRRALDRGFALSDHADWDELNRAIEMTGAGRVLVTHGYREVMTRWLRERGVDAAVLPARYEGELSGEEGTGQEAV